MSAPTRVDAGASAHVVVELHSLGPDAAPDAQLEISFPSPLKILGTTDDHGACAASNDHAVRCELASLASGEVLEVDVEIVAPAQAGDYAWSAAASHAGLDPNTANDGAAATLQVSVEATTAHPAASGGGGGGGGGGASWLLLLVAAGALVRRVTVGQASR